MLRIDSYMCTHRFDLIDWSKPRLVWWWWCPPQSHSHCHVIRQTPDTHSHMSFHIPSLPNPGPASLDATDMLPTATVRAAAAAAASSAAAEGGNTLRVYRRLLGLARNMQPAERRAEALTLIREGFRQNVQERDEERCVRACVRGGIVCGPGGARGDGRGWGWDGACLSPSRNIDGWGGGRIEEALDTTFDRRD
jgi:hypothetical protein